MYSFRFSLAPESDLVPAFEEFLDREGIAWDHEFDDDLREIEGRYLIEFPHPFSGPELLDSFGKYVVSLVTVDQV